jgi:hypothetical protein
MKAILKPPGLLSPRAVKRRLRRGQRFGKYRILRRLGEGGFAEVYAAADSIEGIHVALKIPHDPLITPGMLDSFYREVRLAASLDHPNILGLKNAEFVDGRFVAVSPLGDETLGERLKRRLATARALDFADQALSGVAFAHEQGVIHCDIKPDNFIIFDGNLLRLTDFGIAKIAMQTVHASGSGTVGYLAPEQAMGRPSRRSDVFSLGLVIYRMLAGELPDWPFDWPPPGYRRLRSKVSEEVVEVLARALTVDPRGRFPNAGGMLLAFRRANRRAPKTRVRRHLSAPDEETKNGWRAVKRREFVNRFGKLLETRHTCSYCRGPVSEAMTTCPWCGVARKMHREGSTFPARCPRCHRGMKLDWRFCPWCYGPGFESQGNRIYTDRRYVGRCGNPSCTRKSLMPFMRYCPWCRRKVRRIWRIQGAKGTCPKCKWGVAAEFWKHCPWCSRSLESS